MTHYHILENSVVLNFDGRTETISADDKRYDKVLECIRNDELDDVASVVDEATQYFKDIEDVELVDGIVHIKNRALPTDLNAKILFFVEQELPFDYLIKFWDRLAENPSFTSQRMLYKFLAHNGHPITKDGKFIAYKKVKSDYTDCHTGTFDNSPGQVVKVSRHEVDDDPDNTCSHGLHVATFDYAKGFSSGVLLEVEVDPVHVVCVPKDYNGTKMRVSEYTVIGPCAGMQDDGIYDNGDEDDDDDLDHCPDCGRHDDNCTCDEACDECGELLNWCDCDEFEYPNV